MFKISFSRNILKLPRVTKHQIHNYSSKFITPHKLILNKYGYCNQSSFFPWALGMTTLGVSAFGLSYHYLEQFRNSVNPYLTEDIKQAFSVYIGPNNMTHIQQKLNDISILSKIPWISTASIKGQDNDKIKPIPTRENNLKKTKLSENEVKELPSPKLVTPLDLNDDFTMRASKLLEDLDSRSKEAIGALVVFQTKLQEHSQKLKVAIEDDGTSKANPWEAVNAISHQQQAAKIKADTELKRLELLIKKLEEMAETGVKSPVLKSNASIKQMKEAAVNTKYSISQMQADIEKAQFNAQITNQYKELIQQGRERFKQELASLSPSVSSWTKKRADKLSPEDLNALIIHAHRRIFQLQARIAELESMEAVRLESALTEQRRADDAAAAETVRRELERERSKLLMEKQTEVDMMRQRDEEVLRQALTRQATAHSEHLTQLLRIQREEIEGQLDLSIREALIRERDRMAEAVAGWRMRVEGLEAAVEGRADQERVSREAQDLWVACHALQAVLGGPGPSPPLARYLASFEEAAQPASLPMVRLFLESVPQTAVDEGVCTQDLLMRRFQKVKRTCKRVAMVGETGGGLGLYAVSWLRSLFLLTQACLIERDTVVETCAPPDTHQLLASAELALWRQDLDLAVRLLGLLGGMPRAVANDWIEDARILLETRQAADALGSYTSSKTAGSLPEGVL